MTTQSIRKEIRLGSCRLAKSERTQWSAEASILF